jgi:type II secretory pathway pseudopilin PulG
MAALLVALSVMAVMLTVAMPVWKQSSQREKEAELIFRGQQYTRAVGLFQRRHGPGTLPPTLDALLEEHDLRKKYKDPITNGEFDTLKQGQLATPIAASTRPGGAATTTSVTTPQAPSGRGAGPTTPGATSGPTGGIMGVASKSKDQSIRIYNGRTHYNEWTFVYQPPTPVQPAGGVPGVPGGGGRGAGPGVGPGGIPGAGRGGLGGGGFPGTGGRGDGGGQGGRGGPIGFPPGGPIAPIAPAPAPAPRR